MQTAVYQGRSIWAKQAVESEVRPLSRAGLLLCPGCDVTVRYACGEIRSAHFRHQRKQADCPFEHDGDYNPETDLHVGLKFALRAWAASALAERFPGLEARVEGRIPETRQVADVLVTLPNGDRLALEVQCSPLAPEVWKERSDKYASAGVDDLWFFAGEHYPVQLGEGGRVRALDELRLSILRRRGRVLHASLPVETDEGDGARAGAAGSLFGLAESPSLSSTAATVEVVHATAHRYAGRGDVAAIVRSLLARPFPFRPPFLDDFPPWCSLDNQDAEFFLGAVGVRTFGAPLSTC